MKKVILGLGAIGASAVLLTAGGMIGAAMAAQPHMEAALSALSQAHSELQASTADKGGHRIKAMRLVEDAMNETRAGINFAADR